MLKQLAAAALVAGMAMVPLSAEVQAQDVTLKLHQFLPLRATIPARFLTPWIEKVQQESGGRIAVQHFPSMQLGGKPPELIEQATDGAVDLVWTVLGYTPGRFQRAEAFELPFIMTTGEATSRAFQEYAERHMANDFPGLKVIAVHTHGPGVLHTKAPVNALADLEGMKLRGPTRVITGMLGKLGAVPVGMPVPAMPQSLSKGVIDGTVIPWEITLPLKISELVENHTEFTGEHGLYTATFVFAMNRDSYDNLPDDLKQVIDANSGIETAAWAGRVMDAGDVAGRGKAAADGNNIVTLDAAETARWAVAASSVVSDWVAEMKDRGIDGQALVDEAKALVEKHSR
jgi:TRAP-type C4-dicarboxylate transport system substrate-binding protein